jgi:hypothetical protein
MQPTTDGHRAYLTALEKGFGADVDYARLDKIYKHSTQERHDSQQLGVVQNFDGVGVEDGNDRPAGLTLTTGDMLFNRCSIRTSLRLTPPCLSVGKRLQYLSY